MSAHTKLIKVKKKNTICVNFYRSEERKKHTHTDKNEEEKRQKKNNKTLSQQFSARVARDLQAHCS